MASEAEAFAALKAVTHSAIKDKIEHGFLGLILAGPDYEFLIPSKPGFFYCRIETGLGLEPGECRCMVALDPYTRVEFTRADDGVLEARRFMGDDAARNYQWAAGTMDVPGLPPDNRGAAGPLDMGDFDVTNVGALEFLELVGPDPVALTIASGVIALTQAYHTVETQGGAGSDDLDTITVVSTRPYFFWLRAADTAHTVVVKYNTGNILTFTDADVTLDSDHQLIACLYDPDLDKVLVLGGGGGGGGGITISDGITTVVDVTAINLVGIVLTDDGGGVVTLTGSTSPGGAFPKRARMWHSESITVAGTTVSTVHDTAQNHAAYAIQNPPALNNEFTNGFFIAAGTYTLKWFGITDAAYGVFDWYIDGVLAVASQSWGTGTVTYNAVKTASVTVLTDGWHEFRGKCVGAGSGGNYYGLWTYFELIPSAD